MDLRALRYFLEVVRLRSLSQASGTLHLTQSALSRQMHKLEEEVGGRLLRRSPVGVEPTVLGQHLLPRAEKILDDVARLHEELRVAARHPAGNLTLGIPPGPGKLLVPRLYGRLRLRYPKILLQVQESNTSDIDRGIRGGAFDAAIVHDPGPSAALQRFPLIEEPIYLVARPGDVPPGTAGRPVHFRELGGMPLILPMNASLMTRQLRRIAAECDVRLHTVTQVTSVHIAKAMVLDEGGQTLLGYSSVHDEVLSGALAMRPVVEPTLTRRLVWTTRKIGGDPLLLGAVLSLVRDEIVALVKSGSWVGKVLFADRRKPPR
ncbi:LysR family transcriptional regulator [Stella sp.]|uniref:LysR family transcriptional regulator n=1 Tax=Stella sp. TaxID=2912054 RepID=UPI0035AF2E6D